MSPFKPPGAPRQSFFFNVDLSILAPVLHGLRNGKAEPK
ncbi:hypothetical protein OROGR_010323 [Orobanche gracilis]